MTHEMNPKKTLHIGTSLVMGFVGGLAAGLFLRSEKGKEFGDDLKERAKTLQSQLGKKMKKMKEVTQEGYAQLVDEVVEEYEAQKDAARNGADKVKTYLLDQWEDVKNRMAEDGKDPEKSKKDEE